MTEAILRAFPTMWLYDNQPAPRNLHNGRRLVDVADMPDAIKVESITQERDGWLVRWPGVETAALFPFDWPGYSEGGPLP